MKLRALVAAVMLTTATAAMTFAQDNGGGQGGQGGGGRRNNGGGGGGGGGGGQGGGRNFDPAQFQQQMMDRIKGELKAQDDEWKVIEPKLTKVMEAQREARGPGGFGGRGGRGGGGPGGGGPGGGQGGNQPTTELGTASQELRTALESESTSAEEIDKKLTNFRNARDKANANLAAARKELKEVLTARQEATLVLNGMLE